MLGATRSGLCAALLFCLADGALAQRYECRSQTHPGQIIEQYGVPCAAGTDARWTPAQEAAWRRQQEQRQLKAERARDTSSAAFRGEVLIGMTSDQVLQAWGRPARTRTSESERYAYEHWIWKCVQRGAGSNTVTFRDGKVSSISKGC
jgi:hypothetical protein